MREPRSRKTRRPRFGPSLVHSGAPCTILRGRSAGETRRSVLAPVRTAGQAAACARSTRTSLVGHLSTLTVAALSRTIREVASEVVVGPEHGLPARCAANMHNLFTLRRRDLGAFVATLPPEIMSRIDRAIVFALGVGEIAGA